MEQPELTAGTPIRPRVVLTAIAVFGVLTGLVWHARGPAGWERPLVFVLRHEPLPMARSVVLLWQPTPFAIITLGLASIALRSGRARLACSGAAGCFLATAMTEDVLKPLVSRHALHPGSPMFPSGHVTAAAASAMFAWLVLGSRAPLRSATLLVPVILSWAVVSTGDHYPADAIAGMIVGGLVVCAVVVAFERVVSAAAEGSRRVGAERFSPGW